MHTVRIIPRLDIKGPNLVKGFHLEGLRVLGKPEDFALHYYEQGADELLYMDAVASLYERNSLHDIVSRTAEKIFIPLTVGGGLRTVEDIQAVLRAGADKISINTAAINNPQIIKEASRKFGSSTIVVAIEAIKQPDGKYFAYTDNGRTFTGVNVIEWSQKVADLGAGEILLTSVDNEGTGAGYDIDLIKSVTALVGIPVIAHGGSSEHQHILSAIRDANAHSVCLASMLHYEYIKENKKLDGYQNEGNITFLASGRDFTKYKTSTLPAIKSFLEENNIHCRQLFLEGNK